ncbi:MAG: hypothetical protein NUW22_10725 [Acidobacteria bacterium]|nr:hypothetical protein [Acidobacteriota bacterium]
MSARCTDREASVIGRPHVDTRLDRYPGLRAKVEGMLDIIENAGGDVEKAAVAEQRVIDAIRDLGHGCWSAGRRSVSPTKTTDEVRHR